MISLRELVSRGLGRSPGKASFATYREKVYALGDPAMRRAYHQEAAKAKHEQIEARRRLGDQYLLDHAADDPGEVAGRQSGLGGMDLRGWAPFEAAHAECLDWLQQSQS